MGFWISIGVTIIVFMYMYMYMDVLAALHVHVHVLHYRRLCTNWVGLFNAYNFVGSP